jgi:hypothetical protein
LSPGQAAKAKPATSAELGNTAGVTLDAAGDIFCIGIGMVREVVESKSAASLLGVKVGDIVGVAGNGTAGYNTGMGGPANQAENQPCDVAVDAAGDLFITSFNQVLEVVESKSASSALDVPIGDITAIAGQDTGGIGCIGGGYSGDGGPATQAELLNPYGITLDTAGDIFVADLDNEAIREVVESSSVATALGVQLGDIVTIAGDGKQGYSGDGGPATKAELFAPIAVALDTAGDIFFADSENNVVREVVESPNAATAHEQQTRHPILLQRRHGFHGRHHNEECRAP